jgi:hypothetical protein
MKASWQVTLESAASLVNISSSAVNVNLPARYLSSIGRLLETLDECFAVVFGAGISATGSSRPATRCRRTPNWIDALSSALEATSIPGSALMVRNIQFPTILPATLRAPKFKSKILEGEAE